MKTYAQLLKDPRWQKKRLQVLERDEFTCQSCFDSESSLHVHHCYYETGKKPWEYEESSLVTLCEGCHGEEADALASKIRFTNALSKWGWLKEDFDQNSYNIEVAENLDRWQGYVPSVISTILRDFPTWLALFEDREARHGKD